MIVLLGTLVFLVLLYMYFVSNTIMHAVVQKEVAKNMVELNSEIAILETEYILAQNSINEELAMQKGFISNNSSKIFIDRTPDALVLVSGN